MTPGETESPAGTAGEIPGLIETLLAAERRLEELTAGEVDTVSGRDGRTFVLGRAQAELRNSDAAKQAAILNALPVHIALIDARGVIISVNEAWRSFARENSLRPAGYSVGQNYLEVCDDAEGESSAGAPAAAAGIRSVLIGAEKSFSLEYPCHSPTEERWFELMATPLATGNPRGAVIVHTNITERRRAEDVLRKATQNVAKGRRNKVRIELLLLLVSTAVFFGLAAYFDWFEFVMRWILAYEAVQMNEVIFTLVFLTAGLGTFAFRRWRESESEQTIGSQAMAAMELLHDELDRRVKVRTEEMGSANRSLGTEIAERQRAIEALRESEERFAGAFEHASIGMALVSPEGKWLKINPALSGMLGYSEAEFLSSAFPDITHPDDIELSQENARRAIAENLRSFQFEKRYVHKAGRIVSALLNISLVRDERGAPRYFVTQIQDITLRKQTEDALKALSQKTERRERMLSTMLSSISDFTYLFDRKGRFLFANQPLLDLWGISLEAAVGKDFFELGYPGELAARLRHEIEDVFVTKNHVTGETPYSNPSGQTGYYEYILSPAFAGDGTVDFVVGCTRDISERKRAEEALRASEVEFRALAEAMPQMVWITGADGWTIYFSQQWMTYTGLTLEESLGQGWVQPFHPDDRQRSWNAWQQATATVGTYSVEVRLRRADGVYRWWLTRGVPTFDAAGTVLKWFGTCTDIHDLKMAELSVSEANMALRESEASMAAAQRIAHFGSWEISLTNQDDVDSNALRWSDEMYRIAGYEPGAVAVSNGFFFSRVPDEEHEPIRHALAFAIREKKQFAVVHRLIRPGGEIRFVQEIAQILFDEKTERALKIVGTAHDITERRRAEEAVRGSEEKFRQLAEIITDVFWMTTPDTQKMLYVSPAYEKTWGLSIEGLYGNPLQWSHAILPEDRPGVLATFAGLGIENSSVSGEYRIQRPDGTIRWIYDRGFVVRDGSGAVIRHAGIASDITARKLAERALVESNEKFHQLADNISDAFWIRSPDMRQVHYVSPAFEKIWGRTVQSQYSTPEQWTEATFAEDSKRVRDAFAAFTTNAGSLDIEYRIVRPDGEIRWIRVRGFQVLDGSRQVIRLTGIVTDVTEHKKSEDLLLESQQRLALATGAAQIGIWDLDVVANKLVWNAEMYKLYGVGENEFSGAYDAWQNGLHPEDRARAGADFAAALTGMGDFHSEFRVVWRNGEVRHIEAHGVTQRPDAGPATRMIGVNWDITVRKRAEAELERATLDLLEASRLAGKAEVATEVLHNVGNVLNSVNVASSCIAESLRKSKSADLQKVAVLLREHEADLGTYMTADANGKHLTAYIAQLAAHLKEEQSAALLELAGLQNDIEHIKAIVKMQQNIAKGLGIAESLKATDLVEDALKINAGGLARHRIQVVREFDDGPAVAVEKHKLLQILINLVRNAKDACAGSDREQRRLTVRVIHGPEAVRIVLIDNGVGILPENLTRIFAHGFTTKKDGHGFGLHSGILAAQEMGARLSVASDGIGAGATFMLEVPYKPIEATP